MTTVFAYSKSDVARQAKLRPPGYVAELRKAVVKEDKKFVWIDTAHPAFIELTDRYKGQPRVGLSLAVPDGPPAPPDPEAIERQKRKMEEQGRKQWGHLHPFCLTGDAKDQATLEAFVTAWEAGIPCGPCKAKWEKIRAADPPDAADPFGWSVRVHNAVNADLLKPLMTRAEAESAWPQGGSTAAAARRP